MKKTLIALAVAVFATSGTAIAALGAFSPSNTNNTITFGGSITPDHQDYNVWTWAVGQGYENFNNKISELTNDKKNLTITANENMPLLVGKTLTPFEGTPGISPQIEFLDSKGPLLIMWANDNAEGSMTLTVNDTQQREIGSMTLNVTALAPVAWAKKDASTGVSIRYLNNFSGSFIGSTGGFNSPPSFAQVDDISTAFGAPSLAEMQRQLKSYPGLSNIADDTTDLVAPSSNNYASVGWIYTGAYALGIRDGQSISITFASPVTNETQWKAPLMIQISYD